MLRILLN